MGHDVEEQRAAHGGVFHTALKLKGAVFKLHLLFNTHLDARMQFYLTSVIGPVHFFRVSEEHAFTFAFTRSRVM